MIVSQNCINIIKKNEGLSLKPYLCPAGIPTIGYGNTFYADGTKVTMQDLSISLGQAEILLASTVNKFAVEVNKLLKVSLNQNQLDAVVSFAYNVGIGGFSGSTLLKKINAKDFIGAKLEFAKWNKANGKVLAGLTNRRIDEAKLYGS